MNRSFRAPERGMQPAMAKQRQQMRASVMKEKEEELALFLEMRKREKERINLLIHNSDEFDAPLGSTTGSSPIFEITSATPAPVRKTAADEFLNSENDKNDYEWLLTPPGTPLFPSLEMESQKTIMSETGTPKARPTALKSRLANPQLEPTARGNFASRQSASSPVLHGSNGIGHRPSSSGGPGSRPATPTGRPTLNSSSKPTLTSISKPMLTTTHKPSSIIASKPSSTAASRPSRSSTPTSRATLSTTKPTVPARSSTPTARFTARSSTPTAISTARSTPAAISTARSTPAAISTARSTPAATSTTARSSTPTRSNARSSTPPSRASVLASKPTSRATTPIRRPNALPNAMSSSAPSVKSLSASVPKVGPTTARNPAPPRASSPTVKPRPWKPSEMPGFSLDAPPNLRTSLSDRPISATRGRPGAPSVRSASVEPAPNGRIRRQSCSPSRGRLPNGLNINSGSSVPALNRAYAKATDNVSPGMYGTKMVERVMNMRKLMPPRQDDKNSPLSNLSGKSSSPDSSGFGRTLSKKSLDMAIRHMDIRRSIPGNLRPLMTNIPASSMYSVRSGPALRGRIDNVTDSPLATSSNASSEVSVNNNALCLDRSEQEDDANSERGVQSPASIRGR